MAGAAWTRFWAAARLPRYRAGTLHYSALGLLMAAAWLLVGELGMAMRDRAVMPASLELLRRHDATDHTVSLLLSGVPAVLSLLVSPLIGPLSDGFRSRWGRRRPFLFVLAPAGGLALLGTAASAQLGALATGLLGADPAHAALAAFAVCWTLFAAIMVCVQALYFGLVNDVLPQEWLGRFFGVYRLASLAIGIGFYLWVFPALDHHLHLVIGLIAAVFAAMLMLMCAMLREGAYPPRPPAAGRGPAAGLRSMLAAAMALPHAGWVYAALILGALIFGPFNTFSQYYAESLGVGKTELGELSSMAYGVSMALALPIGVLVDRYGAVRITLAVTVLYSIAIGAGYAALDSAAGFRSVYLLHVVLSGAYFTTAASLPMALFPRLDFLRCCAVRDMLGSLAGIALSVSQGALLDRSGHDYSLTLLFGACCAAACAVCLARLAWLSRPAGMGQPGQDK